MPDVMTEPYYESFRMEDDHPAGLIGFVCSTCERSVDDGPCPDHAPRDVPGLALVECEATPRHWAWVLASDANGYGIPCYRCILGEQAAERRESEDRRNRRWVNRWRYWPLTRKAASWAYRLGVISGYGQAMEERGWRVHMIGWRWRSRPYVLGVSRNVWRCWLVGHHRRGEEVGFGFCGKCVPWPCCGSQSEDHAAGCREAVRA